MILYLPQRGMVKSRLYLPSTVEAPPSGDAGCIGFDFGGQVASAASAESSQSVARNFLLTHLTGSSDAAAGSFFLQILHQHGAAQRQLLSKQMRLDLVAGGAGNPLILKSPYLLAAGDTLTVAITNTGNDGVQVYNFVAANIQVAAWGVYL